MRFFLRQQRSQGKLYTLLFFLVAAQEKNLPIFRSNLFASQ